MSDLGFFARNRLGLLSARELTRAERAPQKNWPLAPALVLLAVFLAANLTFAQQPILRIAAAADLEPLLPPILATFKQQTGIHADASYQSSATLATEIINGAPFDLFLAADVSFPIRVIDAGRAEESQPLFYARGTLVLWTRNDSGLHDLSLDTLRSPAVHTIAIANPQHAPYGRAAQATLDHLGLLNSLRPKLVIAENIAQAAQYADSSNAQIGFISLTSALTPRLQHDGHFVPVPDDDYAPLLQGAVVMRNAANAAAARRFLDFLRSPAIARSLAAKGLKPIPAGSAH